MTLQSKLRSPSDLSSQDIDEMFGLMLRHYDNALLRTFQEDLNEKQWIIELRDDVTGTLKGFSTQRMVDTIVDEREVTALFSGDTIVDRDCWGSPLLAIAWGQLAVRIIEATPDRELYWFLICKGFRTYRFLSVFFEEFIPCWNRETPPYLKRVLDAFAIEKFGEQYELQRGILRASEQTYRVRPEIDLLSDNRRDPHIAFFLDSNPGYQQGDELCCLAKLTLGNFSKAANRLMATTAFARAQP
jgi:hypothetical protein